MRDARVERAFAAVPREIFAGPPPWQVRPSAWFGRANRPPYVETDDDPACIYQDVLIALDAARSINIGQPSLHARCLDAVATREGEAVLQVGTGSGYYTAILAQLVGADGRVFAFEIDPALAERTKANLARLAHVQVEARSGIAEDLPKVDVVYVNAGITQPSWAWLDALLPGGRLLFPLQPEAGLGAMLLIEKPREGGVAWPARFVTRAAFIACSARQDAETGRGLEAAFREGDWEAVQSLHLDDKPDTTCWFRGADWWLSTAPAA